LFLSLLECFFVFVDGAWVVQVFCNMPLHPALLKLLRRDDVKLWLILCQDGAQTLLDAQLEGEEGEEGEDGEGGGGSTAVSREGAAGGSAAGNGVKGGAGKNDDERSMQDLQEAVAMARAAAGTLAMASSDPQVGAARYTVQCAICNV
jgi:hypothetical protein